MMSEKILFVDDEKNVLEAIRRQLAKKLDFDTALGPEIGLAKVRENGPYAVIVSDLRMPVMDGIQFLSQVRELTPDTIRMILTGNADLKAAIEAVNQGNVFRFMTKPCPQNVLLKVLAVGLEQYRLVTAEKELLEKTLKGGIEVMTDLLSMLNPEAFGRSLRISHMVTEIAAQLGISEIWKLETAAMLSQIGWLLLPAQTLQKLYEDKELTSDEAKTLNMNPMISADLIKNIPRMDAVAEIILHQNNLFDGSGEPDDDTQRGDSIPLGSRILKVALDFDILEIKGLSRGQVLAQMGDRAGWYDPEVIKALEKVVGIEEEYQVREVKVSELDTTMILDQDIRSTRGQLVVSKGRKLNAVALNRLIHFDRNSKIQEPIRVLTFV